MKIIVLIVIFAALGGWYCYDKYGEELFPASEEVAYVDPRLEELILLPRGYDALLPFARVDTFLNEDDYTCNRNRQACMVCKFSRIYADISEMVREKLEGIKFGNLLDEP